MRNELYTWLDDLRASGKVNMMSAPQMMESRFGFTPEEAKMNFYQWTQHLQRDEDAKKLKGGNSEVNNEWSENSKEVSED